MIHDLKIWPQYFERVKDGSKTFEVRENDRCFQCGDTVRLHEWSLENELAYDGVEIREKLKGYSGRVLTFKIGFVLPIDSERVVFSLLPEGVK